MHLLQRHLLCQLPVSLWPWQQQHQRPSQQQQKTWQWVWPWQGLLVPLLLLAG
jgi:hypothetical protein